MGPAPQCGRSKITPFVGCQLPEGEGEGWGDADDVGDARITSGSCAL
ncbi:hypothetical protein [Streptomyces sp. NPDC059271]